MKDTIARKKGCSGYPKSMRNVINIPVLQNYLYLGLLLFNNVFFMCICLCIYLCVYFN